MLNLTLFKLEKNKNQAILKVSMKVASEYVLEDLIKSINNNIRLKTVPIFVIHLNNNKT